MKPLNKIKSFPQFLKYYENEEKCIKYFEQLRWNGKPKCPHCNNDKKAYVVKVGYKCSDCRKRFTVKVGTIFESSKIPFKTWFAAIYLNTAHKKGISSVQLALDLNVTQKTAWYMLHRIREMLKQSNPESIGENAPVEIDQTHVGGSEINRHKGKKQSKSNLELANDGTIYNKKKIVIGLIERGGKIVLKHVKNEEQTTLYPIITSTIHVNSKVMTDEANVFQKLGSMYDHSTVNHSGKVYVEGTTHTNTIESFFNILKRTVNGTYHHISEKHINAYLNEFAARYNERKMNPFDRMELFLKNCECGLLYKNLIAK